MTSQAVRRQLDVPTMKDLRHKYLIIVWSKTQASERYEAWLRAPGWQLLKGSQG